MTPFRFLMYFTDTLHKQINLHHFLAHSDLGSVSGEGSSSWGWVADDGREFAVIAQSDGAAFAEVQSEARKYVPVLISC
jgi:hypothetical protein